jgi:transcriptional antiterminator
MTLKELAQELNLSEVTLATSFPRTQKAFLKRGILIKKHGRGENASYTIEKIEKNKGD